MLRGLAVLLATCTLATAAGREWTAATSDHFELLTTGGKGKARSGIQHFEEVRDFFMRALGFDPKLKQKIRLVAFDSVSEWKRYRPNEVASAFYLSGADRDTIAMESLRGEVYQTAVHEYVHLLLRHSGGTFPVWLNEGLAELYSSMNVQGGKMRVGDLHLGRFQLLHNSKWLAMDQLVDVDHASPIYNTKGHAGIFYSQSWALVHMIVLGDNYRPKASEFIKRVAFLETPAAKAFQDVYGKTLFQVQKDLEAYLSSNSIKVFLFDYKREKPLAPEIREATLFEADLAAARLLSRLEDPRDAEEIFSRLEQENANDLALAEAYGFHFLYKNKREEAKPRFERAIAAGSVNPKVHMQYAFMVQGDEPDKAVASMRKAVEAEPADRELQYYLGRMLVLAKRPGEALSVLTGARPVPPEHAIGYLTTLAGIYLQFKNPENARVMANKAVELARSDSDRGLASAMLRSVSQWEQFLAQEKAQAADRQAAEERYRKYLEEEEQKQKQQSAAPRDAGAAEAAPPTLRRRGPDEPALAEVVQAPDLGPKVTGNLRMVECRGQQAVLHIVTKAAAGKPRRFLIEDPANVVISGTGTNGVTVEFNCGPQKDLPVTLTIVPEPNARQGTEGSIRKLEFH